MSPLAVQAGVAHVAAHAGSGVERAMGVFKRLPEPLRVQLLDAAELGRRMDDPSGAPFRTLERALLKLGEPGGPTSGSGPLKVPASKRKELLALALGAQYDDPALLSAFGIEPSRESALRAVERLAPDVPAPVREHFLDWLDSERGKRGNRDVSSRAHRAMGALSSADFREYHAATAPLALDLEGGFAVAIDSLPNVLRRWKRASATEPSEDVRRLMEGNLRLMDEALERAIAQHDADRLRWGRPSADKDIKATRARLVQVRARVHEAQSKSKMSKDESHGLVHAYLVADRKRRGITTTHTEFGPRPAAADGAFPLLSATGEYWGYEHVIDWRRIGVFPIEVPTETKNYDGKWGDPALFAQHDAEHVDDIKWGRYLEQSGLTQRDFTNLERELALLEAAPGAEAAAQAAALKRVLGEAYWEALHPETVARRLRGAPTRTRQAVTTRVVERLGREAAAN